MNRIADLRPNIETVDEARQLMAEIARLTCQIEVEKARLELNVAKLKASFQERVLEPAAELARLEENLRVFIVTHKSLFQKPRKVATEFGSFGLQEATEVLIGNEEVLFEHCVEKGLTDCFKVVRTPVKPAIKQRLEAKEILPECSLKTGDTAVYKVSKSLVDREVETALPERKLSKAS